MAMGSRQRNSTDGGGISKQQGSSAAAQRRQLTLGKILLGSNWAGCGSLHYLSISDTKYRQICVASLASVCANLLLKWGVSFRMEKAVEVSAFGEWHDVHGVVVE